MDLYLLQKINQWAGQNFYLDSLAIFLAQYCGYILILFVLTLLINWRRYWRAVFFSFLTAILSRFVIVEIIRYFWSRPRPFLITDVYLLIDKSNQASFPSGHAAFYFALSFFLFLSLRKLYPLFRWEKGIGWFFLIIAFFISLARVFIGIHWPSDILAGAIVGIFFSWLVSKILS